MGYDRTLQRNDSLPRRYSLGNFGRNIQVLLHSLVLLQFSESVNFIFQFILAHERVYSLIPAHRNGCSRKAGNRAPFPPQRKHRRSRLY